MEPKKIEMWLHDGVMYQILQWLPVITLLRFKLVCKTWRALIENKDFIKQHLHHHHYDLNLKDKNHSLIHMVSDKDPPPFAQLISIGSFEEPNACVRLDCSELHGYFLVKVLDIVCYNGIVCFRFLNHQVECRICLWNPATKQSRLLPHVPFPPATKQSRLLPHVPFLGYYPCSIGFGFDIKSNDYKVVCIDSSIFAEKRIFHVYSLKTNSWRSLTTVFRFYDHFAKPKMPFSKGACFICGYSYEYKGILYFDFNSEMFRSISLPHSDWRSQHAIVVRDEIACVLRMNDHQSEIWVFNECGTVNGFWTKLYTIDTYFSFRQSPIDWVLRIGNYIFFITMDQMCRFNVVTKETSYYKLKDIPYFRNDSLVGFKESLVSV